LRGGGPRQGSRGGGGGGDEMSKSGNKLGANGGGGGESGDYRNEASSDRIVVEEREGAKERGDKEVRMEREERREEMRVRESEGELGESVGDVESGSVRVGYEVGEAVEADRASTSSSSSALFCLESEGGSVAL